MKSKIILLILFFSPFFVLANEPSGIAGFAQNAGDFFTDIWTFFDNDVPNFFQRALNYIIEKIVLFKINAQIESLKFAWSVAKSILDNFQVASKIASAASALPQDVKAALVDMRLFDGVNIIIQALVARYVLRFL
ncbi:DUF2523 family protein [Pseudoalteromonas neustonica]|uniref:DUF2523 family protein n=1 Tax=Pseudoalteromonas neustonica TaxID=1840331 RepID=UPI0007DB3B1B|nr:DUF2523 family protein [Pseudoalteromonas neustonica]